MQIISLISRDDFFVNYNITIPTDDFVQRLKTFPTLWINDKDDPKYIESLLGNVKWKFPLM